MAWFVFDENSARGLKNHPDFNSVGVTFAQGNPLREALDHRECVLLLPGTIAEAPFVLHIRNHSVEDNSRGKDECLRECLDILNEQSS